MTWSYDPENIREIPKDQIRFLIGDVIEDEQLVQDEEIEFALHKERNANMAAAVLCDGIAAMFSRQADSRTGDVEDKFSQRAAAYSKMAAGFRKQGKAELLMASKPLAGGINHFAKQAMDKSTVRVKPSFSRDLFGGG